MSVFEITDHDHEWGPLERSRLAGTVHRSCEVTGCPVVNALDDEDDFDEPDYEPDDFFDGDAVDREADYYERHALGRDFSEP